MDNSENEITIEVTENEDYDNKFRSQQRQIQSSSDLSIDWKKRAVIEFYLQLKSVYAYRKLHNCLTIPIILMSTAAGAAIFSSNNPFLQYIAASLSIGSALLTGLLRQLQPGEKASEHLTAVRKWSRIVNKFQLQEIKPSEDRDKFLSMIETEIDSIFSSQPIACPAAVNSMRKKYGTDMMDKIWFGNDIQEDFTNAREKQKGNAFDFKRLMSMGRKL